MGVMKNTNNKLNKWNATRAQMAADMETVAFMKKTEYHNSAVSAYNAEVHALRGQLDYAMDIIAEQGQAMTDMMKEINELRGMVMRGVRTGSIHIEHTTTTTTKETLDIEVKSKAREPKWNKDKIFREFDHYRREEGLFSNITPSIVRNNWSTIYTQAAKYTGLTLGELLDLYAKERHLY